MDGVGLPYNFVARTGPACESSPGLTFMMYLQTITSLCTSGRIRGIPINMQDLLQEYDFIVVGGGTAGAVVANRLSEVPHWTVLLLEAGTDAPITSRIPAWSWKLFNTEYDWQYKTEPESYSCLSREEGRCDWPRGKALGGSSALNGMMYMRGSRRDYDHWADLGNKGWSYKDVLPYFKKSENNLHLKNKGSIYHSSGGFLPVGEFPYRHPLVDVLLNAGKELGYDEHDLNGQNQTGVQFGEGTVKNGERYSTARAFLHPVRCRQNLHVAKCALATKVILNKEKRAIGVEFERNAKRFKVYARKEIILSGGVINSPQLLMLSGIGPRKQLEELGIDVIQDLKVGENLHDQVSFSDFIVVTNMTDVSSNADANLLQYMKSRTGPLAGRGVTQTEVFVRANSFEGPDDLPDFQMWFMKRSPDEPAAEEEININTSEKFESFEIQPLLLRPKSRGVIRLRSANPLHYPLLYSGYLTNSDDIESLLLGVKFALKLVQTRALQSVGAKLHAVKLEGCQSHEFMSDEYFRCVFRHYTEPCYHMVGTCKMGPPQDPGAVVDSELKVYGIDGLRVIDASIMPEVVSANTYIPTVMIAEKGSDMITRKWMT